MDPRKVEASRSVQAYLAQNKKRLQTMSVDFIVWETQMFVPKATLLTENELRATVAIWRSLNGPLYPQPIPAPPTIADSKLVESVKKAVAAFKDGVTLTHGDGKVNLSVSGLTGELKQGTGTISANVNQSGGSVELKGDARMKFEVDWEGFLNAEVEAGQFHFSAAISAERWELKLSYPEEFTITDRSKLGTVFSNGVASLPKIIKATTGIKNLSEKQTSELKKTLEPHVKSVKEAVEAVKAIAKEPPPGVSVGISVTGTKAVPGTPTTRDEVQAMVTLTIRF